MVKLILGVLIPFIGTSLGAFLVFFMKDKISVKLEKILLGFAGGVMIAASVWSLIIPAIEQSESMGKWSFIPAVVGISLGVLFLFVLDSVIPHLHVNSEKPEGLKLNCKKSTMLVLAVTLHNIPEGMAVGVALAGAYFGNTGITLTAGLVLAIGIAIQNIPEGAIISMPLRSGGFSKRKAFAYGVLSGLVEPIFAGITILLTSVVTPILPYLLSFAAGAMIYVVIEELIPESQTGEHSNWATISFVVGFLIMMVLDVALG